MAHISVHAVGCYSIVCLSFCALKIICQIKVVHIIFGECGGIVEEHQTALRGPGFDPHRQYCVVFLSKAR